MRHLLTAIAAVILLSIAFFMFANNGGNLNNDNQIDTSDTIDSLAEAQSRYYGAYYIEWCRHLFNISIFPRL